MTFNLISSCTQYRSPFQPLNPEEKKTMSALKSIKNIMSGEWFTEEPYQNVVFTITSLTTTYFNKKLNELDRVYSLPNGRAGSILKQKYLYAPTELVKKLKSIIGQDLIYYKLPEDLKNVIQMKGNGSLTEIEKNLTYERVSRKAHEIIDVEKVESVELSQKNTDSEKLTLSILESLQMLEKGGWYLHGSFLYLYISSFDINFCGEHLNSNLKALAYSDVNFQGITLIKEKCFYKIELVSFKKLLTLVSRHEGKQQLPSFLEMPEWFINILQDTSPYDFLKDLVIRDLNLRQWSLNANHDICYSLSYHEKECVKEYIDLLIEVLPDFQGNHRYIDSQIAVSIAYFKFLIDSSLISSNIIIQAEPKDLKKIRELLGLESNKEEFEKNREYQAYENLETFHLQNQNFVSMPNSDDDTSFNWYHLHTFEEEERDLHNSKKRSFDTAFQEDFFHASSDGDFNLIDDQLFSNGSFL